MAGEHGSSTFKIPIVEVFGPTIQGEGMLAGAVSHFVRVGGCDYRCHWCDSDHAVLPEKVREAPRQLYSEIAERVRALPTAPWVTISGGNPGLFDLTFLVENLMGDFKLAVETQGTKFQRWFHRLEVLTVSPKPPSARMPHSLVDLNEFILRGQGEVGIEWLRQHMNLKVPVFDRADFEWARDLHSRMRKVPFFLSVVTRMGGLYGDFQDGYVDSKEEILTRYKQVVDWTLESPDMSDVRVFPQLHALIWGVDERGH